MYSKFIKFVVSLGLLVCCGFTGRILYGRFLNRVEQGKDPRHRVKTIPLMKRNQLVVWIMLTPKLFRVASTPTIFGLIYNIVINYFYH